MVEALKRCVEELTQETEGYAKQAAQYVQAAKVATEIGKERRIHPTFQKIFSNAAGYAAVNVAELKNKIEIANFCVEVINKLVSKVGEIEDEEEEGEGGEE